MKTTIISVIFVVGFFVLGLIINYISTSNTNQEIKEGIALILGVFAIGLPIIALGLMIWSVLFGPYDGPPYF